MRGGENNVLLVFDDIQLSSAYTKRKSTRNLFARGYSISARMRKRDSSNRRVEWRKVWV